MTTLKIGPTDMTDQIQRIPLAKLYVAVENARFGSQELGDLDALAASIVELGELVQPLHVYADDDAENYAVWDGGRRWNALMKLVKGKKSKLPEALAAGIPCIVTSRERARLHSLATFNRHDMHPADEFLAYKAMFDAGVTEPERIAAACAVPTPRVRQLLRLCGVAPAILDAFKAGELALDVVEAFTLSTDHDKQLAVLEAVRGRSKAPSAWQVKAAFREDAIGATDPWAVFVGREAYEAAGGTFLTDLFDRENEDWANGDLVKLLAQQKLDKLLEEVQAEGWAKVEFVERNRYNWSNGLERQGEPWSDEFKASAIAFVRQNYDGRMMVERGYYRASKAAGATGAAALKPDPALHGWSHKGHGTMTQAATQATKAALVADPAAAYDALLTHMVIATMFDGSADQDASLLRKEHRWGVPDVETTLDDGYAAMREAWKARLSGFGEDNRYGVGVKCTDVTGLCDYLADLSADEKAQLLALCFARTLWAYEPKSNEHKPDRWAHLGWMARRAKLDMAAAWSPDEAFCRKASKDALLGAWAEIEAMGAEKPSNRGWPDVPKGDLACGVANRARPVGWLPKLLRDLVTPGQSVKATSRRKRGKADADELPAAAVALATGKAAPIPEPEGEDA